MKKPIDILKEYYNNYLYNSTDLKEISKDTDNEIVINYSLETQVFDIY